MWCPHGKTELKDRVQGLCCTFLWKLQSWLLRGSQSNVTVKFWLRKFCKLKDYGILHFVGATEKHSARSWRVAGYGSHWVKSLKCIQRTRNSRIWEWRINVTMFLWWQVYVGAVGCAFVIKLKLLCRGHEVVLRRSSWSEGKVADALDEKLTKKCVLFSCGRLGTVAGFAGDLRIRKRSKIEKVIEVWNFRIFCEIRKSISIDNSL